jgi:hypothetical protein
MSSCTLVRMTRSKMTQVIEIFGDTGKVRTCGQQRKRLLFSDGIRYTIVISDAANY